MMQALQHRGPDASSMNVIQSTRQKVFMAQNRLRITDVQPSADKLFQSEDGRYTLAYNGEIYNYQLLKKPLEKRYHFQTNTDTEVLFFILTEEGMQGLSKVNGMYAFAFYDRQEEKLLLCRDKFGMKPLYYAEDEKYLVVSSEIKGNSGFRAC
jgi:asparagine synthase (glutamine-hydrolysing)